MAPDAVSPHERWNGLGRRSEKVLITLRNEIEAGAYDGGGKLPTEMELCQRFQVSRSTVRRALARLASEGKVVARKGSGIYVQKRVEAPAGSKTISLMYMFNEVNLTQVQDYLLERGYLLCVFSQSRSHWDPSAERAFLERVKAERHHAVLAFCSPLEPRNDDLLEDLCLSGVRVIHIEHYRRELPGESYVLPDYRRAGHMAAVSLMLAGYHKLFFAGMRPEGPFEKVLEQGFAEAIEEHRGDYNREQVFFQFPPNASDPKHREHFRLFAERLEDSAGIFCTSINKAKFIFSCLPEFGVKIPEQTGIIGTKLLSGYREEELVDTMEFDREALLRRALEEGIASVWKGVRDLVAPRLVRRGTIRAEVARESAACDATAAKPQPILSPSRSDRQEEST